MKKIILFSLFSISIGLISCQEDDETPDNNDAITEQQVLTDFANVIVNPTYQQMATKAMTLKSAIQAFDATPTDGNLATARNAWRDVRQPWEQSEAFLFGPVEDFNYDPITDTWPVNRTEMDSLLASTNPLTLSEIDALPYSLKGYHPIEYLLFGNGGSKMAADFTPREKTYLVSLTESLYNTIVALRNSWDVNQPNNFTNELINAGNGSNRYSTRKEAFITIVTAMAGICEEVADGKMEEPLVAQDSTLEESQFSHNSTTDFKNNIIGVQNAYLGNYAADGHGLVELVSAKQLSLHNKLNSQISAAISSFSSINSNYGAAVYTQQVQIHNAQNAIRALKTTLEEDLINFIQANIKD